MRDQSLLIVVQGISIKIDTCFGESQCLIEFAEVTSIKEFMDANRQGTDPWEMLLSFERPMEAIKEIGIGCLSLAKTIAEKEGIPVYFAGKDEKRQRIYRKLLKRAGIACNLQKDEDGDIYIRVA